MVITRISNVPDPTRPSAILLEGIARVPGGESVIEVKVAVRLSLVDLEGLVRKAADNRTGKSTSGPLTVTVVR